MTYIKEIQEDCGGLNLSSVVVSDEVRLKDPMIIKEEQFHLKKLKKLQGYPSPQKLYTFYDSLSVFEEYTSDLFSLGILALQLIYPHQNLSGIYKNVNSSYLNCSIDLNELKAYINGVTK